MFLMLLLINELIIMVLIMKKIVLIDLMLVLRQLNTHWKCLVAVYTLRLWIVYHLDRLHLHLSSINILV